MIKQSLLQDIYLEENDRMIRFGNARMELSFSSENGFWTGIRDQRNSVLLAGKDQDETASGIPPVILRAGGKRKETGVVRNSRVFPLEGEVEVGLRVTLQSVEVIQGSDSVALKLILREGDWQITPIFSLKPDGDTLERSLRLHYLGSQEVLLRDVRFMVPPISNELLEDSLVEAPGYPVISHFPMRDLPEGTWPGLDSRTLTAPGLVQHSVDAPGSVAGLVAAYFPKDGTGLLFWPHTPHEFTIMEIENTPGGPVYLQWQFLADRFAPGHALEAGVQMMRLAHGRWEDILHRWQSWYQDIGLTAPQDRPHWTIGTAIYEVHVGRAPFLGGLSYEPYPTMADLLNDLPRIHSLGFEVIQIMPHWPFCGYTVHQYENIDNQYGDEQQLRAVVKLAHQLGMRVILDIVLHGPVDKEIVRADMEAFGPRYDFIFGEWLARADECSRYRVEHPQWFMQDEQGQLAHIYTWAFDLAHPSFQDYLIGILRRYLDDLQVDGFRFDAPTWNCMPNWRRDQVNHPSAAYYSAHRLMLRVRQEIKKSHPDALLYTEPSGPLFRHTMDLTYNYDEEWLTGSLLQPISSRGYAGARTYTGRRMTALQVAEWLQTQPLTLPAGSMTVHHLDSHDTYWWGELAQFRHEAFGRQAANAMFALFALIGGGIMTYVGGEQGAEDFYRYLLLLRQNLPVLRYGEADFLSVQTDQEMLLTVLRTYQNQNVLVLINLDDQAVQAVISIPTNRLGLDGSRYLVFDLLQHEVLTFDGSKQITARQLQQLSVSMPAYGVRILQVIAIPLGKQ